MEEPVYTVEAELLFDPGLTLQEDQRQQRDHAARVRARDVLKRYQSGSILNLLPGAGVTAFDDILVSKVIVKLLYLSLADDAQYPASRYDAIAQSCGQMLHQLGGTPLMERVIQTWIPPFDQDDLRQIWHAYFE